MFLTHSLLRQEVPELEFLGGFSAWSVVELAPVRALYILEVEWAVRPSEATACRTVRRYITTHLNSLGALLEQVGEQDCVPNVMILRPGSGTSDWQLSKVDSIRQTLVPGCRDERLFWVLETCEGDELVEFAGSDSGH